MMTNKYCKIIEIY